MLCLTSSLVYIRNVKFAIMLSTRGLLRFENNPSVLRKIPTTCGDQITDRCPGIHPGSGEIPVRKLDDLCRFVYKINIDSAYRTPDGKLSVHIYPKLPKAI